VPETCRPARHRPVFMPEEVQLQVFARSFSTKGPGRGVGTYSIKLPTERYLGGRASFETCRETGTTFTVRYPLVPFTGAGAPVTPTGRFR
jgi:sensor histidine kinase regulating citrate/malate metabolism